MLHADRRFKTPMPSMANALIGIGSAGLLGTTAFQTLDPTSSTSLYTGLLLCEAIAALLVGIATRSRALVLAGAAGAALASLRALVILIQEVPLFIVFGLVAIVLLGGAAALAVLRARFADARVAMTRSWNDWS
jgi:O-antigen ligase